MEQNNKTFEICWPFYQCQAILPNAIGHDIFVWLYLSLFVHINKTEGKPPFYINNKKREEQKKRVRELIRSKFSKELIPDVLLQEIEEQIEKDFCEEINEYKDLRIRPEAESFLNSFEYLFGDDVEIKTVYKDAVSGAILPYFEPIKRFKDPDERPDYKFSESILRGREPSSRLVLKAIKLAESFKTIDDPLVSEESIESTIYEIESLDNEEIYEDDTLDFGEEISSEESNEPEEDKDEEESPKKKKVKKTVKVLDGSYQRIDLRMLVYADEHGELRVDPPEEFPVNKATIAWFNNLFNKAMLTNESLSTAVNKFFPKPKVEPNVDPKNMVKLFSETGKLDKCQELYEAAGHSKTNRADMQLEIIRINDNFYSITGYFHVGRLLDLLGKSIPDSTIRRIDFETFKIYMRAACDELGLDQNAKFKLTDIHIFNEYSRPNKNPDKLPFKELLANAILNNLACQSSPFFYKEVIEDAWYLYGMRSQVGHSNGDVRLKEEDITKLTKLAKFIISIQGGKSL